MLQYEILQSTGPYSHVIIKGEAETLEDITALTIKTRDAIKGAPGTEPEPEQTPEPPSDKQLKFLRSIYTKSPKLVNEALAHFSVDKIPSATKQQITDILKYITENAQTS